MNWSVISTNYWDLWKQPVVMVWTFTTWKSMMINRDHDINHVSHDINHKTIKSPPNNKNPSFYFCDSFQLSHKWEKVLFCKYQTQLLIWTCLSKNNSNKSSKHWKAYYTASHFYQELTQIPAIFYFFYDTKRGELKYRPNISTHTVQTLSKNWHFLAIYSDCLHCS